MLLNTLAATAAAKTPSPRRPVLLSTDCGCEMDDRVPRKWMAESLSWERGRPARMASRNNP